MSLAYWPIPDWVDELTAANNRIRELERELSEARQTIEDVAIGTQLTCSTCGQYHPCNCDK